MLRADMYELSFILAVLCGNKAQEEYYLQKPLNFDLVVELAHRHRVYPIIYRRLTLSKNIPAVTLAQLRSLDDKNKLQSLKLAHETSRLARILERQCSIFNC